MYHEWFRTQPKLERWLLCDEKNEVVVVVVLWFLLLWCRVVLLFVCSCVLDCHRCVAGCVAVVWCTNTTCLALV